MRVFDVTATAVVLTSTVAQLCRASDTTAFTAILIGIDSCLEITRSFTHSLL
jgi:hypothetical protein